MRWRYLAPAVLILGVSSPLVQMYKCVDARGVTHYSDKPRPDCKGGEIDIRPQAPISGTLTPRRDDFGGQEREFQRRQIQRDKQGEAEAKALAERKRRCDLLRAEYQNYQTAHRISAKNAKGEQVYLDDAAREARSAALKTQIERQCP